MHILHLSLDYPSGTGGSGVGTQVHTLAHALIASGHQVTVLALAEKGQPDRQDDRGIEIRRIQPGNIHWYASKIPWLGSRIAKPLRELEYCWISWRETQRVHAEHPVDVLWPKRVADLLQFLRLGTRQETVVESLIADLLLFQLPLGPFMPVQTQFDPL